MEEHIVPKYDNCLNTLKDSMLGGSELEITIDEVVNKSPTNRINWLDVGIGDGKFTSKIIDRLTRKGFEIHLTGIEPIKSSFEKAKSQFPNAIMHNDRLENVRLEGKFDVVHFAQSLHYIKEQIPIIKGIEGKLSEGGILVVTLWSKEDALYRLNKKFFPDSGGITAEEYFDMIRGFHSLGDVSVRYFEGFVDFEGLLKSRHGVLSMLRIISRHHVKARRIGIRIVGLIDDIKTSYGETGDRVNGVITAKKSYDIPNLEEKNKKSLRKKFPSFGENISELQGDEEAKFMCSWEAETRYLCERFENNRNVLEICCAIGGRSIILGETFRVHAIDINPDRIKNAESNTKTFGVPGVDFYCGDALDENTYSDITDVDVIFVDTDWRASLDDPIKKQPLNPIEATPNSKDLLNLLRRLYPNTPVIYKVSPFARVAELQSLGYCKIESMFIDGALSAYNVYFGPEYTENSWDKVFIRSECREASEECAVSVGDLPETGLIIDDRWYRYPNIYHKFSSAVDPDFEAMKVVSGFLDKINHLVRNPVDLGAGTGRLTEYLRNMEYSGKLFAVENCNEMVSYLRESALSNDAVILHEDTASFRIKEKSSLMMSNFGLSSRNNPNDRLRNIYKNLSDDGLLITIGWNEEFSDELSEAWYGFLSDRSGSFDEWRAEVRKRFESPRGMGLSWFDKIRTRLEFEDMNSALYAMGNLFGRAMAEDIISRQKTSWELGVGITVNTRDEIRRIIEEMEEK
uniref:RNA cap guanine-N2 methyltransferase n=1 Tax=Candidatus Kentrum sp. FW TaxID=2126338 RepID=A0A450SBG3_9GAMM|nr:MAG: RNA cap guanine-N2 methyltransferase [Candidatus Kentron sp. FW]